MISPQDTFACRADSPLCEVKKTTFDMFFSSSIANSSHFSTIFHHTIQNNVFMVLSGNICEIFNFAELYSFAFVII